MSSPGVSLDSAIASITKGVESARKVGAEARNEETVKDSASSNHSSSSAANDSRLGSNIDVTA